MNGREGRETVLDKTIPYKHLLMRMDAAVVARAQPAPLPEGYGVRTFRPGDERAWADIVTSVGEFDVRREAREYFDETFSPFPDELARRCFFALSPAGEPVATATAWRAESPDNSRNVLHWVSTHPNHQRRGLARAMVTRALSVFSALAPGREAYLHTQTWSHAAVALYRELGFYLLKTESFPVAGDGRRPPNEYAEAMDVLRRVLSPDVLEDWIRTAR